MNLNVDKEIVKDLDKIREKQYFSSTDALLRDMIRFYCTEKKVPPDLKFQK